MGQFEPGGISLEITPLARSGLARDGPGGGSGAGEFYGLGGGQRADSSKNHPAIVKIRLLSRAEEDLLAGYRFYREQGEGVADYFLESLYADIQSLEIYAGCHLRCWGYFRALAKRFPFAIYYQVSEQYVDVWRILDCRRKPTWIKRQLR